MSDHDETAYAGPFKVLTAMAWCWQSESPVCPGPVVGEYATFAEAFDAYREARRTTAMRLVITDKSGMAVLVAKGLRGAGMTLLERSVN